MYIYAILATKKVNWLAIILAKSFLFGVGSLNVFWQVLPAGEMKTNDFY